MHTLTYKKFPDHLKPGDKVIHMNARGGRYMLHSATITRITSGRDIYALKPGDGGDIEKEIYWYYIVDDTGPEFDEMFTRQALDSLWVEMITLRDALMSPGMRLLVYNNSSFTPATVVRAGRKSRIAFDDGIFIDDRDYHDCFLFDITDNPHFKARARGLTRVSRLNLGDRDY